VRVRIALLTDCFHPVQNGVVHHVHLLRRGLERLGHTVCVVTPGKPHPADGPDVLRYPALPLGTTGYGIGWLLDRATWALLDAADVLHAHHPFLSGLLGLAARRRSGAPLVFTNHTRYDLYLDIYLPWSLPLGSRAALHTWWRAFAQACDAVVAPSRGTAQVLAEHRIAESTTVVPNGIDTGRFAGAAPLNRAALGLPADAVLALYVGRLSAEKNLLALLDAYRLAAQAERASRLLLAGEGPQHAELEAAVAAWGLAGRVRLLGAVSYDEVPRLLAACDIFVSASVSESHPLTFLEAGAAGLARLGVRSPGVSDSIEDGQTGLLAPDAGTEFAGRIVALATNDALRRTLGREAQAESAQHDHLTTARTLEALYAEALQSRGRSAIVGSSTDAPNVRVP
jgi:glycosyltransferase involved in cell wall biosynthesis